MPRLLAPVLLLLFVCGGLGLTTARAQSVTPDQLRSVLLTETDLPGFQQFDENTINVGDPNTGESLVGLVRGFRAADGSNLAVELLAPSGTADLNRLFTLSAGMTALRDAANGSAAASGVPPANFSVTGPLGIGEADLSASWDLYEPRTQTWDAAYADVFRRGGVIGVVLYAAPSDSADPSAVITYAQLQDGKLAAANLS